MIKKTPKQELAYKIDPYCLQYDSMNECFIVNKGSLLHTILDVLLTSIGMGIAFFVVMVAIVNSIV